MKRRYFSGLIFGALLAAPVLAHHGWSSFDQDKPLYLSGTLTQVRWQNPHTEVMLRVDATKLPEGMASRTVPAPGFTRNVSIGRKLSFRRIFSENWKKNWLPEPDYPRPTPAK